MKNRISNLPNFISTPYGLSAKISDLNRNMPLRDRVDGIRVDYQGGDGVVHNQKTGVVLGRYVTVDYNKYKLVFEKGIA